MSSGIGPPALAVGAAQDVEHELGLLDRARQLGRVAVERGHADDAVALQPRRELAGGGLGRLRRVGRQHRVDAVVHVLRQRARVLAGDRRHHVARPVGGQLGAQHDRAARQVAAEPPRAAHDLRRVHVRPRAQLLEERAAQVLLDLLARLLDGDLGQAGHRREVQELQRLVVRLAEQQHAADRLVTRGDRHLAADRRRHRRGAAARDVADVAAQQPDVGGRPRRQRDRAEPRDDDRHGRARRVRRQLGHPTEPLAGQHRVHHLQVDGAQALDERQRGGRIRPPLHGIVGCAHGTYACAAKSGWACSVSSPDSPVRIR